ncbi:hypothetical protein F7725_003911 [Dissostichus mawsoni]|uniref:Helicase ATP-binding domain-containing protein n=1 Tax=Dissostichus mawsoni TaxID=36200 RepID=A0A7J5YCI2_DISMA|nr:hypothetical protein F7725_003911 [Dissostichus mawsoni]
MDYLVVLMLMTSVLACTEQLSRDRVVCIPLDPLVPPNTSNHSPSSNREASTPSSKTPNHVPRNISPNTHTTARGRRTHLVYQQYIYISQVCYHEALPLCSRFFPYMAMLQSLVLVASGSFWLHFPHTSARIEHFLAILTKCCESPWTSQALSHAARQESIQEKEVVEERPPPQPPLSSNSSSAPVNFPSSKPSLVVDSPRQVISLDKSDGEQTRALFERVRKFRSHSESADVIYKVYLAQTVFKLLMVTVIFSYTIPLLSSLSFTHTCRPEEEALVGYTTFECIHVLSSLLRKLLLAYLTLLGLYGLLNLYTLSWILHRDVPDLRNDLAFLLHMLDQYDPLLAQRLSVFLSPVTESRLLEESLERRWGEEKLRSMSSVDSEGSSRLQLVALPRLPPALFTLNQLHVLKLELITEARFTAQERLEVLHLTFTQASEIPGWVTSLRGLHELHLSGRLSSDNGLKRMVDLTELLLQDCQLERLPSALLSLTNLRTLDLQHNNLRTLEELLSLAALRRLSCLRLAYNRVLSLPASVAVLRGLELLDLSNNQLQSLPPALFTLHRLRKLFLAGNLLAVLPAEVKALQLLTELDLSGNRLEKLPSQLFSSCLELHILNVAHNSLSALPRGVAALSRLCRLDLRSNSLEDLPAELGSCPGLHGGGLLVEDWLFLSLPPRVRDFLSRSCPPSGAYSEVQHECIPQAILGMDILCQAKSGMGKTAVFVLATLQQIEPVDGQVSVLVMCHTRELAFQISKEYERFSKYMSR